MRTFSDVVRQNCSDKITPKKLEALVKSVLRTDDRKRAVMMFGLEETDGEVLSTKVDSVLSSISISDKPAVNDCYRVGAVKQGLSRPVKVLFNSQDAAARMLKDSSNLRSVAQYGKVFVSPDRTPEERSGRKMLVERMKKKISEEPHKYHFIRNGEICSREKETSTPEPVTAPSSSTRASYSPAPATPIPAESRVGRTGRASAPLFSGFQASVLSASKMREEQKRSGR